MPYEITYRRSDGGVITSYSGIVTDEDVIRSVEEKCSSEDKIRSYRYALTDCTRVNEFNVTTGAIIRNALIAKSAFSLNREILFVAAVPSDLVFGMGRLWQAYADDTDEWTKLVRTRAEADSWVAEHL